MIENKKHSEAMSSVPNELRKILCNRLLSEGWSNIGKFKKGTGIPYSLETVRRVFIECDNKMVKTKTLAVTMLHLNYSPNEIRAILSKHLDPNDPVLLIIGDKEELKLNPAEEKLITTYRSIVEKQPELSNLLADHLDLLGKIADVPTKLNTNALRR